MRVTVYDFIAFVRSHATTVADEDEADDWLNDSKETMAAEEALRFIHAFHNNPTFARRAGAGPGSRADHRQAG